MNNELYLIIHPADYAADEAVSWLIIDENIWSFDRLAVPDGGAAGDSTTWENLKLLIAKMRQRRANQGVKYSTMLFIGLEGSGPSVSRMALIQNAQYYRSFRFDGQVRAFWVNETPDGFWKMEELELS